MEDRKFPIRVLHVLTAMNRAGTETLLMNYYRAVDTDKVQFDFAVSATCECDYDQEILEKGGRIYHYPKYTGKNHIAYKRWWKNFLLQHPEFTIVHGHIGSTAAIYLKIAKKLGRYTIAHSHNILLMDSIRDILYKLYSRPTRKIADFFFGCSRQALIDRYGQSVADDKLRAKVLNNAIHASNYRFSENVRKEVRAEFNIDDATLVVGTVGRLTEQKNPDGTIKIIQILKESNSNFKFIWVGRGELDSAIKTKLHDAELEEFVIMTGVRADINRILQAMDIFILPSRWEGLGVVLIEAQAAGLPTFCSDRVPKEAKITDLLQYLPLDNYQVWANSILQVDYKNRKDTSDIVIANGYDVESNAMWLQDFYLTKG